MDGINVAKENLTASSHTNPSEQKLKIGLVVESESLPQHLYELVKWCQDQSALTISHLLVMEPPFAKPNTLSQTMRISCFSSIIWLESLLLKKAGIHASRSRQTLDMLIPETIRLKTTIDASGYTINCSESELNKITALQLDVLLMAGSGTLQGGILTVAKYGVISPRYSDQTTVPDGPAGFWEVFLKLDYTGFAVHELSGCAHLGKELISGRIRTQYYYLLNRLHIRQKCLHYLKATLSGIARDRRMPAQSGSMPAKRTARGLPSLYIQVRYVAALLSRLIGRVARRRLKMDFKWNVAFKKCDWGTLSMDKAVKIPNPSNHFLADPFVVKESGRDYCFLEDYDYSTRKGHIAVYQLHDDHAERLGYALVEPFHLSFPYMFRYKSELYMCPETSRNRQIRIYKCVVFPLQWQLHSVLMDDVSAADTMLFERDGRWWMLTNMDVAETGDYCTELSIYWADSPLSNQWTAHPANPLIIDAAKGRNAGLLFDADGVYRVAQKQGFDFYGKAFSINRIDQLDEQDYHETEVRTVQADFFPDLLGTHHMHSSDGITVFDFLKLQNV